MWYEKEQETKEQELMSFLHEKVFDPILNSKDAPANIISGNMNKINYWNFANVVGNTMLLSTTYCHIKVSVEYG